MKAWKNMHDTFIIYYFEQLYSTEFLEKKE